jgi:PKD repeat protein
VANTTFRIEFFSNQPSGYAQGQTFRGSAMVSTNASGIGSLPAPVTFALPAGHTFLSATATNVTTNDTSQFVSIPVVDAITAPAAPVAVNTAINVSANFADAGLGTTPHTAVWNWGDGNTSAGSVTESSGGGSVTGSHTYTVAGVYTVTLTVSNPQGGSGQSVFQYVVVYDPSAGFVTRGGRIDSPAGAYAANLALTGQATFGFSVRYQSGATLPTGSLEFQFPAANLTFHATGFDWLVINGGRAQVQGRGTINGAGNFAFQLTVIDGGAGPDKLRIKIWDIDHGNTVIYDTQLGALDTADPTLLLQRGQIAVH